MVDGAEERFGSLRDETCREILVMAAEKEFVYARDVRFKLGCGAEEIEKGFAALADDGFVELIGQKNSQAAVLTTRGQWAARNCLDIPMIRGESK